jgi:DNA-binding Lrp family transcriptional regulator
MASAFILVSCESDSAELFVSEIRKIRAVEFVFRVSGVYEFLVRVNSDTDEELKKIVMEIRTNNWVRSSSTLMIMKKLV